MRVLINVAMTADGKLAPANRRFIPFGSQYDRDLMMELRSRCDAVMSGARTVDLSPVTLGPGGERYRKKRLARGLSEYNIRVIVSGSGTIDPDAAIFEKQHSPIIIIASQKITAGRLRKLRQKATAVEAFGKTEVDFRKALDWLEKEWNVRSLVCEGGGELNDGLLRAGVVNEVYVTICPVIFGGRHAPTMSDGRGFQSLDGAMRLNLERKRRRGDELYLVFNAGSAA